MALAMAYEHISICRGPMASRRIETDTRVRGSPFQSNSNLRRAMFSVTFKTLGCKLNQAESAMMMQDFIDRGYMIADENEGSDVSVINTCTVTRRSDAKCRQAVRQALRAHPGTTVIVVGCYSQVAADQIAGISGVDYVFGVQEKLQIFKFFPGPGKLEKPVLAVTPIRNRHEVISHAAGFYGDHTRAVMKIQSGCDQHCTYCIVPAARGPRRSVPLNDVLKQAQKLIDRGYKEIVLTGVHVGEYGKECPDHPDLPALLQALTELKSLERIRLTSLEPENITSRLLSVISDYDQICRHFHLSFQSASPEILKRMGRPSDAGVIRHVLQKVTDMFPEAGLGADILVGFPGETEKNFEETRELLGQFPFSYLHVFPYSARPGTPAAMFPDQIPSRIRRERARELRELGKTKAVAFRQRWMGRRVRVLLEGKNRNGWMSGWTSEYLRVQTRFDPERINTLVFVEIEAVTEYGVRGCITDS